MKGLQDVVNQAKALVQRLREKETAVDATLKDVNTLSEQLTAMRQFREEAIVSVAVSKSGASQGLRSENAATNDAGNANEGNHKKAMPNFTHQPIVLALLSENRRLAALEAENAELVKCLEEYQSALDMIMHKYRSHVTKFASANQLLAATIADLGKRTQAERTATELRLLDRINDMSSVMRHACELDDNYYADVVCLVTRLHNENRTLRELLDAKVTGNTAKRPPGFILSIPNLPPCPNGTSNSPSATSTQSVILQNNSHSIGSFSSISVAYNSYSSSSSTASANESNTAAESATRLAAASLDSSPLRIDEDESMAKNDDGGYSSGSGVRTTTVQQPSNGLPYRLTASAGSSSRFSLPTSSQISSGSSYIASGGISNGVAEFKLPKRRPASSGGNNLLNSRNSNQLPSGSSTFLATDSHAPQQLSFYSGNENPSSSPSPVLTPIHSQSKQSAVDANADSTLVDSADFSNNRGSNDTLNQLTFDSDCEATPMPSPATTPHPCESPLLLPSSLSSSSSSLSASSQVNDDNSSSVISSSKIGCVVDGELEPPS